MGKVARTLGLLILIAGALLGTPVRSAASESPQLTVGPHGAYPDLKSAVAAAQAGQRILLEKGIYHGRITIDKPLELVGEEGTILDGDGKENVILVAGTHDVSISHLAIRNSGGPSVIPYAGVKIVSSQHVTVRDVTLSNIEHGVYLEKSSYCTIANNEISGKTDLLPEDRGDGVGFWNSDHNSVLHNHIWDVRDGVKFDFSKFTRVSANQFDHLRYGIHYMYSDDNTFDHNFFTDDVAGATPMYSKRITFTDNVFAHFPGERAYAILLQDSDDCIIKGNLVMESNVGFHFDHSDRNLVEGNAIINCGVAFRVLGTSTANKFTKNLAQNNVIQVASDYQALPNQWSLDGEGNYWSDYEGYDFAGTGIGAIPYVSSDYLAQAVYDQPILELFADSPGMKALARGMELFPLWNLPSIQDPYPLLAPPSLPQAARSYLNTGDSPGNSYLPAALSAAITLLGLMILRKSRNRRRKNVAAN